ncbi:propionate kinase, partial [Candidatus Margulisiibacteriota bacterium]
KRVVDGLEFMDINLDEAKNKSSNSNEKESDISPNGSKIKVFVIPTDEERVFIEDVVAIMQGKYDVHTRFKYTFQDPKFKRKLFK